MMTAPEPDPRPSMLSLVRSGPAPTLRLAGSGAPTLSIGVVLHDFALGGTERIAIRLAWRWAQDGAEVTLFAGSCDGPLLELLDPRVRLVSPPEPIRRARGSTRRLGAAAAAYFTRHPVEACFVPGNYHWPVASALAGMAPAVRPVVAVQVSAALRKPQRGRLRQIVYDRRMRRLLAAADVLVTLSDEAAQQADAILGRAASLPIALPALDDGAVPHYVEPPTGRTILAAGRLVREKGFDTLIRAFADLVRSGRAKGATLVIIGEGPDRARLTRLSMRLGLGGQVSMPGYASDVRPWLDRARLFVMPSRFEGYGAVVVEALAAGRAVIATRCTPAVDDLLRGTGAGLDVPIDDAPPLAEAIATLLDSPAPDPARLSALVDHHRIGRVARDYTQLFRRLIAARGDLKLSATAS